MLIFTGSTFQSTSTSQSQKFDKHVYNSSLNSNREEYDTVHFGMAPKRMPKEKKASLKKKTTGITKKPTLPKATSCKNAPKKLNTQIPKSPSPRVEEDNPNGHDDINSPRILELKERETQLSKEVEKVEEENSQLQDVLRTIQSQIRHTKQWLGVEKPLALSIETDLHGRNLLPLQQLQLRLDSSSSQGSSPTVKNESFFELEDNSSNSPSVQSSRSSPKLQPETKASTSNTSSQNSYVGEWILPHPTREDLHIHQLSSGTRKTVRLIRDPKTKAFTMRSVSPD
jgi:hypothetical protein